MTNILSREFICITPLKLPFFLCVFSNQRNITAIIKQQLQIKTTLEKNFMRLFMFRYFGYPRLPVNIGTKEKFSKDSSSTLPSAFFVKRNIR